MRLRTRSNFPAACEPGMRSGHAMLFGAQLGSGEVEGYYADFADTPVEQLGRALTQGFIFQGQARLFPNEKPPQ